MQIFQTFVLQLWGTCVQSMVEEAANQWDFQSDTRRKVVSLNAKADTRKTAVNYYLMKFSGEVADNTLDGWIQ